MTRWERARRRIEVDSGRAMATIGLRKEPIMSATLTEACALIWRRPLGTHRFQRAVSAGGALGSDRPSNQDCTLEAMRTQGATWKIGYKSQPILTCSGASPPLHWR